METAVAKEKSELQNQIRYTLAYFDIFSYPLTLDEIRAFMPSTAPKNGSLQAEMNDLIEEGKVFLFEDCYSLKDDSAFTYRRLKGNQRAIGFLKKARRISKFIGQFPFVRGVFISGSLSKGYMGDDADIDYFIVTAPNRLWLSRTLLILFKKIFLLNSRKYFCVNYFIDDEHLEIEEKNIYTAVELSTLVPTFGKNVAQQLEQANQWVVDYLPNKQWQSRAETPVGKRGIIKQFLEFALNGSIGNWLEQKALNKTLGHWKHKFSDFDQAEFEHALKSRSYVSKHHPQNFQKRVLDAYRDKIASIDS